MSNFEIIMIAVFWAATGLLAYGMLVYPGLMWLVTRRTNRAETMASLEWPKVNVVIPAHNEEAVIAAKLANTAALDYPRDRIEIIVVSDGSTDRTVEIASQFAAQGVRVLDLQPNRGKASALNEALKFCEGDVLCLCDANVMFQPDALQQLVSGLNDPTVGAVSGDVRLMSEDSDFEIGETSYYSIERMIQFGESQIGSMIGVDGGMYVIRRELFQPLPDDTVLDDFTTSMRVLQQGRRIVYEPRAVATENGTPSWRQEFRRRVRVKCGAVQTVRRGLWPPVSRPLELWQYLSHKAVRWLGPIWLIALLSSSLYLANRGGIYRGALLIQLAFLGIATTAWVWPRFRKTRLGGVAFYFTLSHLAMLVGLVKGMFTSPSGVWERTPRVSEASANPAAGPTGDSSAMRPQPPARTFSTVSGAN